MNVIITFGQQFSLKTAMFGLLLASVFLSGCASTTITDPAKRADLGMPSPGKSKVIWRSFRYIYLKIESDFSHCRTNIFIVSAI